MKRTRNTKLMKALGNSSSYEHWYSESPWLRTNHISQALNNHSPLRTRDASYGFGFSCFQLTADGRKYTVLVMADDPSEWIPMGSLSLRDFIHRRLDKVDDHHIRLQMDKELKEFQRRRAEENSTRG